MHLAIEFKKQIINYTSLVSATDNVPARILFCRLLLKFLIDWLRMSSNSCFSWASLLSMSCFLASRSELVLLLSASDLIRLTLPLGASLIGFSLWQRSGFELF